MLIAATTIVLAGCSTEASQNNIAGNQGVTANGAAAPSNAANTAKGSAPAAGAARSYTATLAERWPAGSTVTPAEVRTMLTARGARTTVQTLATPADGPNRWNSVIRGIALGEQAWLDLVPQVRGGTDAGTTDEIVMALSDAVISNPTAALRLFAPHPADAENFCTENGFETPADQSRAFYAAAIAAVESVTAPELQAIKASCLAQLRTGAATPAAG